MNRYSLPSILNDIYSITLNLLHISSSVKMLLLSKKHLKYFYTAMFLCTSFASVFLLQFLLLVACMIIFIPRTDEYAFFLTYIDTLNYWCSQCKGSLLGRNHKMSFVVRNNVRCIYPVGTSLFSHICFPGHGFSFILLVSSVLSPHRHLLHSAYCVFITLCHAWDISKKMCFYNVEQRI